MRAVQISVIGSGGEWEAQAEEIGRLLAERGCTVVTGGEANEWIDHAVATGTGHARNLAVAASGDAVIAVGGSWGTLSEIAFARRLGRPTVVLDGGLAVEGEGILRAASPEEAVELALSALES